MSFPGCCATDVTVRGLALNFRLLIVEDELIASNNACVGLKLPCELDMSDLYRPSSPSQFELLLVHMHEMVLNELSGRAGAWT